MRDQHQRRPWWRTRLYPMAALVFGLLAGIAGRQAVGLPGASGRSIATEREQGSKTGNLQTDPGPARVRSQTSVEEILEDRSQFQYGHLALWLLDASSAEMEEMFRRMLEEEKFANRKVDLLMRHWTRIDLQRALEVAGGTKWERIAWWGWAKVEPEAALEAAIERRKHAALVLRGIGQIDPDLAMRLRERFPEASSHVSIDGIAYGLSQRNPQEAVEFARRHGHEAGDYLKEWARREPKALLDWCARNEVGENLTSGTRNALRTLVREHLDKVEKMVGELPLGRLRGELLRLTVEELAGEDAAGARALADREESTHARQGLYAAIGMGLMGADLGLSLELLREVSAMEALAGGRSIRYPHGSTVHGAGQVQSWVTNLATIDPEGTISVLRASEEPSYQNLEGEVLGAWLQRDEAGVAARRDHLRVW